jgi:hypothetical protein
MYMVVNKFLSADVKTWVKTLHIDSLVRLQCYGAETLGNRIYVRGETLRLLLVLCTGPF